MENSKQTQPIQKEPQRVDPEEVRLQFQELLKLGREVDKMLTGSQQTKYTAERQKLQNAKGTP